MATPSLPGIAIDLPHLCDTGMACSACLTISSKLLRCSGCFHAWYCNQDCQRAHFKVHKPFCKALKLFEGLHADLPRSIRPADAREFYVQRLNARQLLQPLLRRPLSRSEARAIMGEAKCCVCMRTREQLSKESGGKQSLACCPYCNWGWVCPDHEARYMEPDPDPPGLVPRFCGDEPPPLESLSLAQGPAEEGGSGGAAAGTAAGSDSTGAASAEQAQAVPASAGEGAAAAAAASAEAAAAAGDSKPGKQGGAGSSSGDGSAAGSTSQAKAAAGAASTTQAPPVKGVRHSKDICETYALMNACELLVHNMLRASGRLPSFCPEAPSAASASASSSSPGPSIHTLPSTWADYKAWRRVPGSVDPTLWAVVTKRLGQALTTAFALAHHYSAEELGGLQELHLAVVGAGGFEVPADNCWEEVMHLVPGTKLKALHVDFVGPELSNIIVENEDGLVLPKPVCGGCTAAGRVRSYAYHMCTYHDYLKRESNRHGAAWSPPQLVVAFNSGIHEDDERMWQPTLKALVSAGTPVVFTSYNKEEALKDAQVWEGAGGKVTLPPCENPFRGLEPIMEPSTVDLFYYFNYFLFCGKGAK